MNQELSFVVDEELFNSTKNGDLENLKRAIEGGRVSPNACFGQREEPSLLDIAAKVFFRFDFFSVSVRKKKIKLKSIFV